MIEIPAWITTLDCNVTVCNTACELIYMNEKAEKMYGSDILGKSLRDCHTDASWAKMEHIIATGESNSYTIEKRGVKKMIHQLPYYQNGKVAGIVELSVVIPFDAPHYIR